MTASRIPRSTNTRRSHGPTRARQTPGELALVPDVPRQVKAITVRIEQLDEGRIRMTMPNAPGWVDAGRTPVEIVQMLRRAFTEAQVSAHAAWRGTIYDHPAAPQLRRNKPRSRGKRRADCYSPEEWALDDRGRWVSPKGHRYPEDRQVIQRVIRARRAMGLPDRPGKDDSRQRLEQVTGTQLAMRLDPDQKGQM